MSLFSILSFNAGRERRLLPRPAAIAAGEMAALGGSILAAHAGELPHPWLVAIEPGMKSSEFARMIAPYLPICREGQ